MKNLIVAAVAALGITGSALSAKAADWTPPGPIKLMIAFGAGGGADTQARLIAEELESRTGWELIPEQVTGKGGVNLLKTMKDMPNDGSVIGMVVTESLGYNLYAAKTGMTPADFTGLTTTAGFQMGVVSQSSKGWASISDAIAAAKAGEQLRFGVMSPRLADLAYLLGKAQGVEFNIISVKGGKAVMNGVTAGDMDLGFMAGIQRKGVAAGDLVNLASALSTPLVQTPEAPTFADLGVAYDSDGYVMFAAPAGMPEDARNALTDAIADIASDPETKAGGLIQKAFGGAAIIKGADLDALTAKGFNESESLIKAASE